MEETKQAQANIHVVAMSSYTTPELIEERNQDWIGYGKDNDYFQYLIDRYTNSPTNQTIINGVVNMIYGKGLSALDASRKPNQFASLVSLVKKKDLKRFITDRKMLGMSAFKIRYQGKKIAEVTHFPMQTLRAQKVNDEGVIENWYHHPRWDEVKRNDKLLKKIPVFGSTDGKKTEILVLQPYVAGYTYYSPVDYNGALPYAVLEEEIGDYLINDTINGFSGTTVINFNNGVPTDEQQRQIKNKVTKKLIGATGEKTIVSFNSNKESQTDVQKLPLDNAPEHYQYLSEESEGKLLKSHKAPSWLLGANNGGNGLSSNADEIKNSMLVFDNLVIKPYQEEIIEVIDSILAVNDISLRLYFITIQPLEFIETAGLDKETKEEETGIKQNKMSTDIDTFSDEEGEGLMESLKEDSMSDEWELVDKREYSEDNEEITDWANKHIKQKKKSLLARIIKSNPSADSTLDKSFYKVRYEYSQKYSSGRSRNFCVQMMSRTGRGVVYRKEDIDQASFSGVNKSFGHNGRPYSLFKFKGGVNCGHFWSENLYRLKTKTDGTPFVDRSLSSSEEVDTIPQSAQPSPAGNAISKIAPKDMPNNGAHPSNIL